MIHQWDIRTFILSLVGINLAPDLINSAHLRPLLYVTAHKSIGATVCSDPIPICPSDEL